MNTPEIRGLGPQNCLSWFVQSEPTDYDFVCGGLFRNPHQPYMKKLAIIIHKLLNNKNPQELPEIFTKFRDTLMDSSFFLEGKALYEMRHIVWNKFWPRHPKDLSFERHSKDRQFHLISGQLTESDIEDKAGLIFVRLLGMEGGVINRRKVWEGRKKVIEIWETHSSADEVKGYLAQVRRLMQVMEECLPPNFMERWPSLLRLGGYLAPVVFGDFEGLFLITRAALFERRLQAEALLKDLETEDKSLWEDLKYGLQQNGLSTDDLLQLMQRLEEEEFLTELRKDWKHLLQAAAKDKVEGLKGAFLHTLHKEPSQKKPSLSYGTFHAPSRKIKLYVFYEDSLKELLPHFCENFIKLAKRLSKYIGSPEIHLDKLIPIDRLIYGFERLKKMDLYQLKPNDSAELLFSLLNFACRLRNLQATSTQDNTLSGCLLLLNTDIRQENGSYPFWDYFSFIYDFFGLPVQTLNRQTIDKVAEDSDINTLRSIYKNLFISLLKDQKKISFEYQGFNLPDEMTVYAIMEKPSAGFCYSWKNKDQKPLRHFLYEIYQIQIKKGRTEVDIRDKTIILAGSGELEKDRLYRWMEGESPRKDRRFCFITAGKLENSPLYEHLRSSPGSEAILQKCLFLEYMSLPTAYISERAVEDCVVIYSGEFERLRRHLGLETNRLGTAIALKPADVKERFILPGEGQFYHSHLQVFSTENPGWEDDELYSQKKDLLLFSVLALSLYESESFQTPYSKLDLWQRKRTVYFPIGRDNREYRFALNAILYEVLYLVSSVRGEPPSDAEAE